LRFQPSFSLHAGKSSIENVPRMPCCGHIYLSRPCITHSHARADLDPRQCLTSLVRCLKSLPSPRALPQTVAKPSCFIARACVVEPQRTTSSFALSLSPPSLSSASAPSMSHRPCCSHHGRTATTVPMADWLALQVSRRKDLPH
jgi:hypothetical protein